MVKEHTIKLMAALVAFMMLAVGAVVIVSDSQSDATNTGNETVNVYFDGSGSWVSDSYYKFNVFQAIQAACGHDNLNLYIESDETDWTETTTENGTYPNPDYGTISAVGKYVYDETTQQYVPSGITSTFKIYGSTGDGNWDDITDYALGWIRPFTDYGDYAELVYDDEVLDDISSAYSNIAIQMNNTSLSQISTSTLMPLTDPEGRQDCLYTFHIKDTSGLLADRITGSYWGHTDVSNMAYTEELDMDDLETTNGITVYGYGSDAFLALVYAINGGTYGQTETYIHVVEPGKDYYTNYSWMDVMFSVGTVKTPTTGGYIYDYWATYKGNSTSGTNYASFNLGYHSQIPDAYEYQFPWESQPYVCNGNEFTLDYEHSTP